MTDKQLLHLTRPSFSELATALSRTGRTDLLEADGRIHVGGIEITSDGHAPSENRAARLAAQFLEASEERVRDDVIYEDEDVVVTGSCNKEGFRVTVTDRKTNLECATIPTKAMYYVAAEILDCLST